MLISRQLVHRVPCVPAGLGATGSYIPTYIFLTHFMVFCLNCQRFGSRGFICQRPCSSVRCEEKIRTRVKYANFTLQKHILVTSDAQKVKSNCEEVWRFCFKPVENNAKFRKRGVKSMWLWIRQCQK